MKFLVDAQLPPALARAIAAAGHEAVHVGDLDMLSASDAAVWAEARSRGAAIITKDEDFILISRTQSEPDSPAVVWLRTGNCTRKALLDAVLPMLEPMVALLEQGEKVVELRQ